jgi:hypothetical protein
MKQFVLSMPLAHLRRFFLLGSHIVTTVLCWHGGIVLDGPATAQEPPGLRRFIEGLEATGDVPFPIDQAKAELKDPLGLLLIGRIGQSKALPATLDELIAAIEAEGFTKRENYLLGEGGQIPVSPATNHVDRGFRVVLTREKSGEPFPILISVPTESRQGFVEAIAWDPQKHAFNYYRRPEASKWIWEGDSGHAIESRTAGKGCFGCHVNGSPIMKELKLPWNNWNSQSALIPKEAVPASSPLFQSPLLDMLTGAERLEREVVRPGVHEVTANRLSSLVTEEQKLDSGIHYVLRQLFFTTTVNLTSSRDLSQGQSQTVHLPATLFLNVDALSIGVDLGPILQRFQPAVAREIYDASLRKHKFALADKNNGFSHPGDTFFALLVPEPSIEDIEVLRELVAQQFLSSEFIACVLMVDFPNPVYSSERAKLLRYVPSQLSTVGDLQRLPAQFAKAVARAAGAPCTRQDVTTCSPERQFLHYWNLPDARRQRDALSRISDYLTALQARLATPKGFDDVLKLGVSRRHQFKQSPHGGLIENPLLFPENTISKSVRMKMLSSGMVRATQ